MNTSRILGLVAVTLAAQVGLAGTATIASIKGRAGAVTGDNIVPAVAGQTLNEGSIIETADGANLKLRLSNGTTLVLGPKTRIVLKFTGDTLEISLLRGTISGNFKPGTTVRSAAGVANVGGIKAGIQFTSGTLVVAPTGGAASVKPAGNAPAVTIPAGNVVTISPAGTTKPSSLTPEQVIDINTGDPRLALIAEPAPKPTSPGAPQTNTAPQGSKPDLTQIGNISPGA